MGRTLSESNVYLKLLILLKYTSAYVGKKMEGKTGLTINAFWCVFCLLLIRIYYAPNESA